MISEAALSCSCMKLQLFCWLMPSLIFPLCKGGLRGILSFKSLPTSLYKGRSKRPDNSFHILISVF